MKIIVNGLDLNEAIAKVSKALPSRDVSPVLECIKVTAENDKMTLFATDKDLAIEKTIDANVIVSGAFLVPGRVFCDYIRSIANETDISLEMTDENRLEICTSGSECNIATLDLDDYPEMEEIGGPNYFAVQESSLKEIINNVIFAVATDDTRPMLKGVNFEAENYTLTAVATDGYRFAMSKKAAETRKKQKQRHRKKFLQMPLKRKHPLSPKQLRKQTLPSTTQVYHHPIYLHKFFLTTVINQ